MAVLTWDNTGERYYETGVKKGVLYAYDTEQKKYTPGVAWNGLTGITESPSGADETALYADDIKYLSLRAAEEFGATIEAYTYPDEWTEMDGTAIVASGVSFGQQVRKTFGLSYRTIVGNDVEGDGYGYKLHLLYGCTASPSERSYATVNDSPEAITFSWEIATVPVTVSKGEDLKPTACITIDTTKLDETGKAGLAALEKALYGEASVDPYLPSPDEVYDMFTGANA